MNLSEITAQFQNLMNRGDLRSNPALATTFLNQAILRIQRELRVPMMESTILYTIPGTYVPTVGLAIPNDLLELKSLLVGPNNENELTRGQLNTVKYMASNWSGGHPIKFARLGGNWVLGPAPLVGDVIMIQYYASFPALVNPTDSNVLTIVAWDLLLYAALSASTSYWKDERKDGFEAEYNRIAKALQDMADGDELTGDAAVGPVYAWPDDGIN